MPSSDAASGKEKEIHVSQLLSANGDINTIIQFDGILHRFHRTELKPVFFGLDRDCGLLLVCFGAAWIIYHAMYMFFWSVEKRQALPDIWDAYFSDKILMTGLLMSCWFTGYNLASYAIWANFECRLPRDAPPDDFEVLSAGEAFDTGMLQEEEEGVEGDAEDPKLAKMASQTLLVTMPSGELVIGCNTRSQSAASMLIVNNKSSAPIANNQNE